MLVLSAYTVASGDTLFAIARRFNMSVDEIKALNALKTNDLRVGQTLKVKSGSGTTAPVTPTKPTWPTAPVTPTTPSRPIDTGNSVFNARQQFLLDTRPEGDYRRYFLTVPLSNGGSVVAIMRDNLNNSPHMVYPQGIMYPGQSLLTLDLATIQSVGLTLQQARALQYVSTHEGKFDAINSYDRGIFSYGFIQFVGAQAHGASLNKVLHSMKMNAPSIFQRIFQRAGIDVEGGTVTIINDAGRKLAGDPAWLYFQENVRLCGAFIQAGFEPLLVREQLRMANELYVQPSLNFRLDVPIGSTRLRVAKVSDIFSSEGAITAIIALCINQGIGGMLRIVGDATGAVAARAGLTTLAALTKIDERQVIEQIAFSSMDERVKNRVNGVLMSGLSFV